MFVNPYLSIKASFLAGFKETMQFRAVVYSNLFTTFIRAFLLISIWGGIYGYSLIMPYTIMLAFICFPGVMPLFRVINEHYEVKIKEGWSIAFSKPLDAFLFSAFYSTGKIILAYITSILAGFILLYIIGYYINPISLILASIVIFIFELSIAYFVSSFSYFVYHLWGFRVFISMLYLLFSGLSFPLINVKEDFLNLLQFFPFTIRGHFIAISLIENNSITLMTNLLLLLFYSILIFAIGYFINKIGIRKFESQGG